MAELTLEQRSIILQYRLVDGLKYSEIEAKMKGVKANAALLFTKRVITRSGSTNINKALKYL